MLQFYTTVRSIVNLFLEICQRHSIVEFSNLIFKKRFQRKKRRNELRMVNVRPTFTLNAFVVKSGGQSPRTRVLRDN